MQTSPDPITAVDFLLVPVITIFVVAGLVLTVRKFKPGWKPKVPRPVFVGLCIAFVLTMASLVMLRIATYGYR